MTLIKIYPGNPHFMLYPLIPKSIDVNMYVFLTLLSLNNIWQQKHV